MSQRELAVEAGVGLRTIFLVERGIRVPRFRSIRRLCVALEVEPTDVTEFAAAMANKSKTE